MERIFLIGYMGVGKTTLGKALAQKFGVEFIDLDLYIQARYQKTIAQLFEEYGETGFREIENKMLKEVGEIEDIIISTGGGAPCFFDNMDYMNEKGKTVYLKASPGLLFSRLKSGKDKRPLLQNKTDEELYNFIEENLEKRNPHYLKAHYIFETDTLISRDEIDKHIVMLMQYINKQ